MMLAALLAASDYWSAANTFWSNLEGVGKNGIKAGGVILIAICILKGGTIVRMLGIVLTVGIALYAVANLNNIGTKVGNTIDPVTQTSMGVYGEAPTPPPAWLLGTSV